MIETEEQRRWWFATHPEYSWSRKGARSGDHEKEPYDSSKIDPEAVDAYVDRMLKYEDGPVADLLRSVKRNFGTEGQRKGQDKKIAQADRPQPPSDSGGSADRKDGDKEEPTLWEAIAKGIDNTLQDWQRALSWLGARLPPKGTRERARIEAARNRGRDAKKKEELADILAGGKGSGVWSEAELAEIRRTKNFPLDTEWHHDPTVANRPDLAADPRSVRPIRGGRKGHLRDGHNMDWRNPRK
jgi:hypothetical protein